MDSVLYLGLCGIQELIERVPFLPFLSKKDSVFVTGLLMKYSRFRRGEARALLFLS